MRHNSDLLFSQSDWFSVAENQKTALSKDIMALSENQVLNTSVDDLSAYLVAKHRIDVPVLNEEGIHADQHDTQIDVSRDQNRYITDRSRPFYISGTTIEVIVPFVGEAQAFKIRPTTYTFNPPPRERSRR